MVGGLRNTNLNDLFISSSRLFTGSKIVFVNEFSSFQNAVNSVTVGSDATFFLPTNTYNLSSGENVLVNNLGDVNIYGFGSTLKVNSGLTGSVLTVSNCRSLTYDNLNIDINFISGVTEGLKLDTISGKCNISYSDFKNFTGNSQFGIYTNKVANSSLVLNYQNPGLTIHGCNFYNPILVEAGGFDYNNNNAKGRGIYLFEETEYYSITSCKFRNLSSGIISRNGANGHIANCDFLSCYPRTLADTGTIAGALWFIGGGSNGGKVTVLNSKFNHNYGYSVWSDYDVANRPIHLDNCQFIANHITPVVFFNSTQTRNRVTNSFFDRASAITGVSNDPFTAVTRKYVDMRNSYNKISNNTFLDFAGITAAVFSTSGVDNNEVANNTYNMGYSTFVSLVGTNNKVYNNYSDVISRGRVTLTAGTATVSNSQVTTGSNIKLTGQDNNVIGALRVNSRSVGVSFTITSSTASDSGVVYWELENNY